MRTQLPLGLLATAFTCLHFANPASATSRDRVFVASYGNDANPCTFGSPCKTFQQAVNVVAPGGEVTAIDSAGFGPITITQAVTITSPTGVEAGNVPVSGVNAITITAGPTDANVLRGLTLNGSGVGNNGIEFDAGASLTIQNSQIQQFKVTGIYFVPNVASHLSVTNTSVINNGNDGIAVFPTSGVEVNAVFNHVEANNNGNNGLGMNASRGATIQATASDSVAANNVGVGFNALSGASGYASLSLFHCTTSGNSTGMEANGSLGLLQVAQTYVGAPAQSGTVWSTANNGTIWSFSDNYSFFGNAGGIQTFSKF